MESVVLVIHLFLALAIIGLVLLQRSEGGGLGIGGGGGGLGNLASAQTTANFLTRATAICAAGFFCTSLILGILAGVETSKKNTLLETMDAIEEQVTETPETPLAPVTIEKGTEVPKPDQPPAAPIAE